MPPTPDKPRPTGRRWPLIDAPVISEIPEDYAVPASIAARTPVVLYRKEAPASKRLVSLTLKITGAGGIEFKTVSFLDGVITAIKQFFKIK